MRPLAPLWLLALCSSLSLLGCSALVKNAGCQTESLERGLFLEWCSDETGEPYRPVWPESLPRVLQHLDDVLYERLVTHRRGVVLDYFVGTTVHAVGPCVPGDEVCGSAAGYYAGYGGRDDVYVDFGPKTPTPALSAVCHEFVHKLDEVYLLVSTGDYYTRLGPARHFLLPRLAQEVIAECRARSWDDEPWPWPPVEGDGG